MRQKPRILAHAILNNCHAGNCNGSGYVGIVTRSAPFLSGTHVMCVDTDAAKIETLQRHTNVLVVGQVNGGCPLGAFARDTNRATARRSRSGSKAAKNRNFPESKAFCKPAGKRRRNKGDRARTGRKNPGRQETQTLAVGRESAARARRNAGGMMQQVRPPSVKHREGSDLRTQVLVSGHGTYGFGPWHERGCHIHHRLF